MTRTKKNDENILNFFAEAGKLKYVKRSGWWMAGVSGEESVADHSFRCAVIGYVLAKMEKASIYKVMLMTLFNDLHEARINDLHKLAGRYLDAQKAENQAFSEQIRDLDGTVKTELGVLRCEYNAQETIESVIARDADILECLIQAKEYADSGFVNAKIFFKKGPEHLKTKSACRLWRAVKDWDSSMWWQNLSRFER